MKHQISLIAVYSFFAIFLLAACSSGNGGGDGNGSASPADITRPTVTATSPSVGATDVAINSVVTATFSEAMAAGTLTNASFTLKDNNNIPVSGNVAYAGTTASFTPAANLAYNVAYTATITTAAVDAAGNALASDYVWSFTTAPKPNVVFVTSVSGTGNLNSWTDAGTATGLAAGDAICQARATAAGLSGTFKAWLSDSTDDAYCRIHNLAGKKSANCGQSNLPVAAGPWIRTDDFPFADTIDQLLIGKVYAPVRYNESGNLVAAGRKYFTATDGEGKLNQTDAVPCANWTSNDGLGLVRASTSDMTSFLWTFSESTGCSSLRSLLCVQTGSGAALPSFSSTGKKIFLTSTTGTGNLGTWADAGGQTGLAAGDAICQARAAAAGLANAGNFKAWLSTATTDAKDRITSNGPWVRLDGVKVADDKADLIDGALFTSINPTDTGIYTGNQIVWTGTNADGTKTTDTCNNWANATNTFNGTRGRTGDAGGGWSKPDPASAGPVMSCDYAFAGLYCLEN